MRRTLTTPFFPDQGYSMFDFWAFSSGGPVNTVTYTAGRTATRPAVLGGPTVEQHWLLISVAVQAYLRWVTDVSNNVAVYGKLGAIVTGLSMDQPALATQAGDQYLTTIQELPTDTSLLTTLWDPGQHSMPPSIASQPGPSVAWPGPPSALAVSAEISPPNPIDLFPGVQPVVGIWMLPSLLGVLSILGGARGIHKRIGLDIVGAKFTLNYDDGD